MGAPSFRLFLCDRCGSLVSICSACDRGNRYCGPECRNEARAETCREAKERYQASELGKRNHARRQKAYRWRQTMLALAAAESALFQPLSGGLETELGSPRAVLLGIERVCGPGATANDADGADDAELENLSGASTVLEHALREFDLSPVPPGSQASRDDVPSFASRADAHLVVLPVSSVTHHGSPTCESIVVLGAQPDARLREDSSAIELVVGKPPSGAPECCIVCGRPNLGRLRYPFLSGEDPG